MKVLLIRHGQTDSNASGTLQGHLPTALNSCGLEQAERLVARFAASSIRFDRFITSDLRRAVETAAPIERVLGMAADRDAAWRERSFGALEGRQIGDTEIWRAADGTLDPPEAEPLAALQSRVELALETLAAAVVPSHTVAVVTHGGVIRTALHLFASGRLTLADAHETVSVQPILNASILHLAVERRGEDVIWRVERMNDVDHLASDMLTVAAPG